MNYKKFETQLNKLSNFFEATKGDGINDIERELLKSYVLKLYEHLHAEDSDKPSKSKKESKAKTSSKTITKTVKAAAPAKVTRTVKKKKEPVEIETVEIVPEVDTVIEPVPAAAAPVTTPSKAKAKVAATPVAKTTTKKSVAVPDDMKDLFADFSSKELGDKLSQMPIKDLTKALSINERVFTIKELFGGDSDRFRSVLSELNEFADFDAAKKSLMNGAATDFKWYQTSKIKKARNFIKIVKRRYN